MSKLKEVQEIAEVILVQLKPIQIWSSKSQFRAGIVFLCFTVLLEPLFFGGWYYMMHSSQEDGKVRSQELQWKASESGYLATLNTINLCLENSEDARRLRKWYCQIATDLYKNHSRLMSPDRAKEVVQKKAYGMMKIDITHLLHQIEFDKVLHAPETPMNKFLANAYFFWGSVASLVIIDFAFAYWLGFFRIRRNVSSVSKLMY